MLQRYLRPGDTFADIGAHIGIYSLIASRVVGPTGKVIAVEADPDIYNRLVNHLHWNNAANIHPYNVGIADRRVKLPFYRWSDDRLGNSGGNSFVPTAAIKWEEPIQVECVTLSDVFNQAHLDKIDAIKLDIERMEYRVLKQFLGSWPTAHLPRLIMFEQYGDSISAAGGSAPALLESCGYYQRLTVPGFVSCNFAFVEKVRAGEFTPYDKR